MRSKNLTVQEVNTGSMADIAFLLLIFFLVTTTILQDKGLMLQLPPKPEDPSQVEVHDRNLFKIQINSENKYLVNGSVRPDLTGVKAEVMAFVMNNGRDPGLSDNPEKAVVSIKTNRGTDYGYFIAALDEVKDGYYEIYGSRVGLTGAEYRALDVKKAGQHAMHLAGKNGIPMNISIAQPEAL